MVNLGAQPGSDSWKTKPTDRFILKWIKIHLSARITPHLLSWDWLRPWMITLFSSCLGVLAGLVVALGWAWIGGFIAASAQVLDGVDGQFSRLTGRQSKGGAFWDSVMDRYADGAMVVGISIYLIRQPSHFSYWLLGPLGYMALVGSNLISYSSARAENLGIDMGRPTLASKGTRSAVMIVCAWGSLFLPSLPLVALGYLAVHPNLVVIGRLCRTMRSLPPYS